MSDTAPRPDTDDIAGRAADLAPEEVAAGSDDPTAQAEAILAESEERMQAAVEGDDAPIARLSEETVDPVDEA